MQPRWSGLKSTAVDWARFILMWKCIIRIGCYEYTLITSNYIGITSYRLRAIHFNVVMHYRNRLLPIYLSRTELHSNRVNSIQNDEFYYANSLQGSAASNLLWLHRFTLKSFKFDWDWFISIWKFVIGIDRFYSTSVALKPITIDQIRLEASEFKMQIYYRDRFPLIYLQLIDLHWNRLNSIGIDSF